jgi:uncharacterized membrane protein
MKVRGMVRAALIAALYVALCIVFAPSAYGPVQLRVAEALTLLPVLCPEAVAGLAIGCFVANLLGGLPLDMVVGTAATLLAALATRRLRHIRFKGLPLAAALPPVLFNAVIVGIELSILYMPAGENAVLYGLYSMGAVGLGQLAACFCLGVPLVWLIEKNPAVHRVFSGPLGLPSKRE